MADTMRALVIEQVGETAVMEKPIPSPGPRRRWSRRRRR